MASLWAKAEVSEAMRSGEVSEAMRSSGEMMNGGSQKVSDDEWGQPASE